MTVPVRSIHTRTTERMEAPKTESARTTEMLLESSIRWRGWMTVPVKSIHTRMTEMMEVPKTESARTTEMLLESSIQWRALLQVGTHSFYDTSRHGPGTLLCLCWSPGCSGSIYALLCSCAAWSCCTAGMSSPGSVIRLLLHC